MNANERDDVDRDEAMRPLRSAWNELPTPPIERLDALDREIEAWTRAAWTNVASPVAIRPRARWRRSIVSALGAAALVCLAIGLGMRGERVTRDDPDITKHVAAGESTRPPRVAVPTVVSTLDAVLPQTARTELTSNRLIDQAYASNRAGLFRDAAAFATVALDTAGTNAELRCAALVNRIHAEQALGRVDEAERLSTTLALALSR